MIARKSASRSSVFNNYDGTWRRWVLFLMMILFGFLATCVPSLPAFAAGAPTDQVYNWGNPDKGGPSCSGSGCSYTPQLGQGFSNVVTLDAANSFNLAILSNSTVVAWGNNQDGQLGDGTTQKSSVPVAVSNLSNVIATATGNSDALALLADGTVVAWGNNQDGQLGDGSSGGISEVPVAVTGLSGVTAIAAGGDHAYALLNTGKVMAWGSAIDGQLGDNNSKQMETSPVPVTGLSGVQAISSGNLFGLALLNNSTVMSWGYNQYGQLGNGTTTNSLVPVPVTGLSGVTQISGGGDTPLNGHALALLSNGTVEAWGDNADGQLGNGNTTNGYSSVPVAVLDLSSVTSIAAGGVHSMALSSDGTVSTWGNNQYGQLGNGSTTSSSTPVVVPTLSNVELISAGSEHSLAALPNAPPE